MRLFGRPKRSRRQVGHCSPDPSFGAVVLVGLALAVAPALRTNAQDTPNATSFRRDPYAAFVSEAADRFGIPEGWIRAVLRAESAGDTQAVSEAGAIGLMQIMPDTWAELRLRYRLGRDPMVPRDNILAGSAYLREMYDRYGNVAAMLAAYNAGPARYDEYLARGRTLPAETRAYVAALTPLLLGKGSISSTMEPVDWRAATLFSGAMPGVSLGTEEVVPRHSAFPDGLAPRPAPEMFPPRSSDGDGP